MVKISERPERGRMAQQRELLFLQEIVPVVKMAFLNFYWNCRPGRGGYFLCLVQPEKASCALFSHSVAFGNYDRFLRVGTIACAAGGAAVAIFAAYCVIECLRFAQTESKVWFAKIGVVALCVYFLAYRFIRRM